MKSLFLLIGLLFIIASGFSQAMTRQERYVLELSKRKFEWLANRNYDSLVALLDDKVLYVHSSGWVQNKKTLVEDLQSGKLSYVGVAVKESGVRMYNNNSTAIVTGLGTFTWMAAGKEASSDLYYTEVYIKAAGHWKLASRHANKM
ncbi:hypothetical protein BH09BAC3_BH09BAC3_18810 [soil metagenome]